MVRVAVVTDSNSGITLNEAKEYGIFSVPMPFMINGKEYFEEISLGQAEFYKMLKEGTRISTAQPSVGEVSELWEKALESYDQLVYIPMSSGLSESCNTATRLAENYGDRVKVVNNQRISVTQRISVFEALDMAKEGADANQIADYLNETKYDSSIYIMVDTLKYLRQGGRITPAAAALGSLLKVKPILQIQGEKLDKFAMALNLKQSKDKMIKAMKSDIENRFKKLADKGELMLAIAYTDGDEKALAFREEVEEVFKGIPVYAVNPLSLSIACHIGPGALALACARKSH